MIVKQPRMETCWPGQSPASTVGGPASRNLFNAPQRHDLPRRTKRPTVLNNSHTSAHPTSPPPIGELFTTTTPGYLNFRFFFFMGFRRISCAAAHNVQFRNFTGRRPLSQRKGSGEAYRLGSNLKLAMQVLVCRSSIYNF